MTALIFSKDGDDGDDVDDVDDVDGDHLNDSP